MIQSMLFHPRYAASGHQALTPWKEAKYKAFNKLTRSRPPAKAPQPASTPQKSTRAHAIATESLCADTAKSSRPETAQPSRRGGRHLQYTPTRKPAKHIEPSGPLDLSPALQGVESTPAHIRAALGPTPQRDGQVLGLFDLVTDETPLKKCDDFPTAVATGIDAAIASTPTKSASVSSDPARFRSPQSSGKRHFLHAFAGTPLKRKREGDDVATTGSSSKRKFATPSFLRRSFPLARIQENAVDVHTIGLPGKRGLVRSLSTIIHDLKKREEERMDDEWDIMNEMEQEGQDDGKHQAVSQLLVQDRQATDMPLGPDQSLGSSAEESGPEQAAYVRKSWKKKGLKRQTRRVIMRPVLHTARKADEGEALVESDAEIVAETQPHDGTIEEVAEDAEDDAFNVDSPNEEAATKRKGSQKPAAVKSKAVKDPDKDQTKKKARKVDANAHANFRALKIKNKNSKASGRGRKYGRR